MALCAGTDNSCQMIAIDKLLEKGKPFSIALLRVVIGIRLIAGTWLFVIQGKPVQGVIDFFLSLSLPVPAVSAYLSIYAQFVCGLMLVVGWFTRQAGLIIFFNFTVAILAAHLNDPIEKSFQAWALWACSFYFLLHGAGQYSVDWFREKPQRFLFR